MSERIELAPVSRRTQTFAIGLVVLFLACLVAWLVQVPLVALGPGPTYNTLGDVDGKAVVTVVGRPTYPTSGHLNLTTVQVEDGLSALKALRYWADSRYEVVNRNLIYPPGKSDKQVEQDNARDFADSESNAAAAALSQVHVPVKVFVGQISQDAPAAGVLQNGDQLLSVNGQQITAPAQVNAVLMGTRPNDKVSVVYRRGDSPAVSATVTVGVRPRKPSGETDGPQGFLGVVLEGVPIDPHEVDIKLGDVGGPSAGLMFALAVVDKLTPGELTAGRFVAGTGEISSTGLVGKIGGVSLKMLAAREAGATVFLVPESICDEAKAAVPDGLQLIKVSTLDDAVAGLTALNEGRTPPGC